MTTAKLTVALSDEDLYTHVSDTLYESVDTDQGEYNIEPLIGAESTGLLRPADEELLTDRLTTVLEELAFHYRAPITITPKVGARPARVTIDIDSAPAGSDPDSVAGFSATALITPYKGPTLKVSVNPTRLAPAEWPSVQIGSDPAINQTIAALNYILGELNREITSLTRFVHFLDEAAHIS